MYLNHWALRERPFQNTYDPAHLYRWGGHEEVLSRMRYTLEGGRGLLLLTGPTGCGKSFLCRYFADDEAAKGTQVSLVVNPINDPADLLHQIREGLGILEPGHARVG